MEHYTQDGTLTELPAGIVLLERDTGGACPRRGLVLAFDLDAYEYTPGSSSPIRPTEKTVVERIPPRLKVREGASIELPHIMLLIDDPEHSVIEPLYARREEFSKLYEVELMQAGGHLTGWFIPESADTDALLDALARLSDREVFDTKYGVTDGRPVLPYAVGDGNHSMATAKAYWEQIRPTLTEQERETHPARWVLAEVVNIHDESIVIEGIHRALFGVDAVDVLDAATHFFRAHGAEVTVAESVPSELPADVQSFPFQAETHTGYMLVHVLDAATHFFRAHGAEVTVAESVPSELPADVQSFPFQAETHTGYMLVQHSPWALPVAALQTFLDDYLAAHPEAKIDYIHGLDVLHNLASKPGTMGFELPDPAKEDLFRGVIFDGVLPRKTFSMGEAREKRFYMEAKRI